MAGADRQGDGGRRLHPVSLPGHLVTTRATHVITADSAAAALLQRDVEALLEKPLAVLLELDDRREIRERLVALPPNGTITDCHFRVLGPDGGRGVDLVATIRASGDGAEEGDAVSWTIAADPTPASRTDDPNRVDAGADMASELRQLAHELNQPLAAIVMYVRGTQMRLDSGTLSDADLRATLDVVVNEALRATKIVRDLDQRWGSHE